MSNAAANRDLSDQPDGPAVPEVRLVAERGFRPEPCELLAQPTAIVQPFRRTRLGKTSEKLDPTQPELALNKAEREFAEVRAQKNAAGPAMKAARTTRRDASRGALPAQPPRIGIVVERESLDSSS